MKRLERKKAGTEKREERVVAEVGGKREFSVHHQDREATGTSENKKQKNQGCHSKQELPRVQ